MATITEALKNMMRWGQEVEKALAEAALPPTPPSSEAPPAESNATSSEEVHNLFTREQMDAEIAQAVEAAKAPLREEPAAPQTAPPLPPTHVAAPAGPSQSIYDRLDRKEKVSVDEINAAWDDPNSELRQRLRNATL